MIIISRLWYVTTAVHLWRFYFRYDKTDPAKLSDASRENWYACNRAIRMFTDRETDLLRQYFLTSYGDYEDIKTIAEYAEQNGIPRSDAWDIVKKANYEVIVQRGLMERKEGNTNAKV